MKCEKCDVGTNSLVLHGKELWCWPCHNETKAKPLGEAPGIATDGIPGGILIRNGICNEDGSPRRFYSKSEIMKAAYEKNLTVGGNTPKPNQRVVEREAAEKLHKQANRERY